MRTKPVCTLTLFALVIGCADPQRAIMKDPTSGRNAPDLSYRLEGSDRSLVAPAFDADALEEFLQMHEPDARAGLLKSFHRSIVNQAGGAQSSNQGAPDVSVLTRVSDPALQAVLERVWAPTWADLSTEELEGALKRPSTTRTGMAAALRKKRDADGGAK
jgi:hypothetical protein